MEFEERNEDDEDREGVTSFSRFSPSFSWSVLSRPSRRLSPIEVVLRIGPFPLELCRSRIFTLSFGTQPFLPDDSDCTRTHPLVIVGSTSLKTSPGAHVSSLPYSARNPIVQTMIAFVVNASAPGPFFFVRRGEPAVPHDDAGVDAPLVATVVNVVPAPDDAADDEDEDVFMSSPAAESTPDDARSTLNAGCAIFLTLGMCCTLNGPDTVSVDAFSYAMVGPCISIAPASLVLFLPFPPVLFYMQKKNHQDQPSLSSITDSPSCTSNVNINTLCCPA